MAHQLTPPFITAMIVPTGIGAAIGGFGGDATPAMNLLASVSDILITHPNVANAACFQQLPDNALYVEGYGLDQFFKGQWALQPVRNNRVGVVLDSGMTSEMKTLHHNAIAAVQTVYGVDIIGTVETSEPVQVSCEWAPSGVSTGQLQNEAVLLAAAQQLVSQGATAMALCVYLSGLEGESDYESGQGVDPVGGIEAILSHWVVSQLKMPCANSPVFSVDDAMPAFDRLVNPKTAAEFITPTFLPCVLTGLSRAPQFVDAASPKHAALAIDQLSVLVVPATAMGSMPVLSALQRNIPVIAVQENTSVCGVGVEQLRGAFTHAASLLYTVRSYDEAAGLIQRMKLGLAIPKQYRLSSLATEPAAI